MGNLVISFLKFLGKNYRGFGLCTAMNNSSSIRQRQLSHLNSQVAQLHANLTDMNELIATTCTQYLAVERLGKLHAAMFMASHAVFESDNFEGTTGGDKNEE